MRGALLLALLVAALAPAAASATQSAPGRRGNAAQPARRPPVGDRLLKRAAGRYGHRLTLTIPAINTIPGSSPAAISAFRVEVGARVPHGRSFLEAPRACPRGGLPFAGRSGHADGSSSSAQAAIACTLRASTEGAAPAAPSGTDR